MRTIYLRQPKNQKSLNILLAVIFISQGILNLTDIKNNFDIILGVFQVTLALAYIFIALSPAKPNSKLASRISLNDQSIELKKGLFGGSALFKLDEIKLIQFKPEKLTVMSKEFDHSYSIDYEVINKQEIIAEVEEFAKSHAIPVEHISYRNV